VDVAEKSSDTHRSFTPSKIKENMNLVEENVHVLRRFILDDEVIETTSSWVPDTGTFRGQTSQYLKIVDIY
jgi:hypothetical protein